MRKNNMLLVILVLLAFITGVQAAPVVTTLTSDFAYRDALPQTLIPQTKWNTYLPYGPNEAVYPKPILKNRSVGFRRDRIIEVAKHFYGVYSRPFKGWYKTRLAWVRRVIE